MKFKIVRERIGPRGGGVEIDLKPFGYDGLMTAYNNYLGGGITGAIVNSCNIVDWKENEDLEKIAEELRKYYFKKVTEKEQEFHINSFSYEEMQGRPSSAY